MKHVPIKLGPLALLLAVISICLTTLALLNVSTAKADERLAEKPRGRSCSNGFTPGKRTAGSGAGTARSGALLKKTASRCRSVFAARARTAIPC